MSPLDENEVNEKQSTDVIEKAKKDHEEKQNDGHGAEEHDGEHSQIKMMPLFSRPKQRQRWGDHQKHPRKFCRDVSLISSNDALASPSIVHTRHGMG
jgi:hypothetical protein